MISENHKFYISAPVGVTLASLLYKHGVRTVFVSPGSRNASLIEAIADYGEFNIEFVVDERSAAFAALGYALVSSEPVAIICTSGTAPLNYAPAIAEAFYRRVPLIAVTADRPLEWIGQDDSQTINQEGIFRNFIKEERNIPVIKTPDDAWFANRVINEALIAAMSGRPGPVHLNIRIPDCAARPYFKTLDRPECRSIEIETSRPEITVSRARDLSNVLASPVRVMILAGFMSPDQKLNRALSKFAMLPNVVVLCETISNLHSPVFIRAIDRTLRAIDGDTDSERYLPDVVITLGGALVSRHIKQMLRKANVKEHWHVGLNESTIDCFRCLTRRIELDPALFFEKLAAAMQIHKQPCDYADMWHILNDKGLSLFQKHLADSPWSALKAFGAIIPMIPARWNVHFSNGTAIRYAQLLGDHNYHRCDCNRGVSGIDGSTSTAVGASIPYKSPTLLISGDTSALYDLSAFALQCISPKFKMIVINNQGGGIFRFIKATRDLPVREDYLCGNFHLPLRQIADGFGFRYIFADNEQTLRDAMRALVAENERPAILEVKVPAEESAEVLKSFFADK